MASVFSGFSAGQVAIEMRETRARNMRFKIRAPPGIDIGKIVAAIENDPVRIIDMRRKFRGLNEGNEFHQRGAALMPRIPAAIMIAIASHDSESSLVPRIMNESRLENTTVLYDMLPIVSVCPLR